ncbi:hypothetical protein LCGC14_1875470 [marine sediment metagenome]|uniref:Uncharacterized protein n=1 Tax=marine sediment metagenome TaxID=412755 RepID=A0A0F9GRX0_9ZZZZ
MPKTKLGRHIHWIRHVKNYKNKDERCRFHWTPHQHGYCWSYASWVDYQNGDDDVNETYKVKDYIEFCKDCEYWKGA